MVHGQQEVSMMDQNGGRFIQDQKYQKI
jgi:hypothetical protein